MEKAMKIIQIIKAFNEILGLGDDGKVYIWEVLNGTWLPYKR